MVNCNECKHEFEIKVRVRHIQADVEEVFFNCPNCHERYTSYYLNDNIKQKQKQLKRVKADSLVAKMLVTQIEQEMNLLEKQYSTQ